MRAFFNQLAPGSKVFHGTQAHAIDFACWIFQLCLSCVQLDSCNDFCACTPTYTCIQQLACGTQIFPTTCPLLHCRAWWSSCAQLPLTPCQGQ